MLASWAWVLAFALASPAAAFLSKPAPAIVRAAYFSTSTAHCLLPNKALVNGLRRNTAGLQRASMSLLSSLLGNVRGGRGRDYSDLKPGDFPAETAQYALNNEVKAFSKDGHAIATFGGGCFWGVELLYQRVPGVIGTAVGYTQVVQLSYDPSKVSMKDLAQFLFSKIDPTLKDQVGNDQGSQYRHGVYFHTEQQRAEAQEVFEEIKQKVFYPAEEYHQQYLAKGGRGGRAQSPAKGCQDPIRCYG